jgi:hypothetical protein
MMLRLITKLHWILSICYLGAGSGGMVSKFELGYNTSARYCEGTLEIQGSVGQCHGSGKSNESLGSAGYDSNVPTMGSAVLLFNFSNIDLIRSPSYNETKFIHWTFSNNSAWLDMVTTFADIQMSSTLCYNSLSALDASIVASSHQNRTEPTWGWDVSRSTYTTENIREQLGAKREVASAETRGIMKLDTTPQELRWQVTAVTCDNSVSRYCTVPFSTGQMIPTSWYPSNYSLFFCSLCNSEAGESSYGFDVNPQQALAFQNILQETGRPALALQAYYMTLMRMIYYDNLPLFDYPGTQSMTFFTPTLIPQGYKGLAAVITATTLHLALVLIIFVEFLASTRSTMLGNAWQALAQLVSAETKNILEEATAASDSTVERWLRGGEIYDLCFFEHAEGRRESCDIEPK